MKHFAGLFVPDLLNISLIDFPALHQKLMQTFISRMQQLDQEYGDTSCMDITKEMLNAEVAPHVENFIYLRSNIHLLKAGQYDTAIKIMLECEPNIEQHKISDNITNKEITRHYQDLLNLSYKLAQQDLTRVLAMADNVKCAENKPYIIGLQLICCAVTIYLTHSHTSSRGAISLCHKALAGYKQAVAALLAIPEVEPEVEAAPYLIFSKSYTNLADLTEKPKLKRALTI